MTWPIRMVEAPTFDIVDGKNGFQRLQPGDAWFAPHLLEPDPHSPLAPNYHRDWAGKRPPIIVAIPARGGSGIGDHFCIDQPFWRDGKPYGDGWVVTGEPPLLTLSPSVDIGFVYHGFIRDGVIGPDLEAGNRR